MADWIPNLSKSEKPRYLAIADVIADDVRCGRLVGGDRLPPQRKLASHLDLDFTTVARGYVEAKRRGLVESRVGQGTFVRAASRARRLAHRSVEEIVDLSMNLPPEPTDAELLKRMREGIAEVSRDITALLRYQNFGGTQADKDAASMWLGRRALVPAQERIYVTPGAHPAIYGILSLLAKSGDSILCEEITYPGIRSIAAQQSLRLIGLPVDEEGIKPDAFAQACVRQSPKALYLNPTLHNPTTLTMSETRREAVVAVARRYLIPIIEDDAYGFIPARGVHPLAAIGPDITWHIAGLAKCIGAGLRAAYVVVPNVRQGWLFAAAMRAANVMASPLTVAVATRWIEDGTAEAILAFIRSEAAARQKLAKELLPVNSFRANSLSFNIWLPLPNPWTRSAFVAHMRSTGIGIVPSDAFVVAGEPPEQVRVCLGGLVSRDEVRAALDYIAHALDEHPALASKFF